MGTTPSGGDTMTMTATVQRLHRRLLRIAAALIAATLLGALVPPAPASADIGVGFNDGQLEAKIRTALGVPSGSITTSMMAGLTYLDISNAGITDLTGLEYATGLVSLAAQGNQISDLTSLVGLSHLQQLNLSQNKVADVSDLGGLENLIFLSMGDNQYTSIASLSGLTKLTVLAVNRTGVTDLSPVSTMTSLTYLGISEDDISDLTPLTNLTALTTLYAGQTKISDLTPLAGLTNLDLIDVDNDPIASLEPLAGLANLREFDAGSSDTITDLAPLASLSKLQHLGLSGAQIYDISALTNLSSEPGWVYLDYNWLDLTPGSSADQVIAGLTARGYTVYASPQRRGGKVSGIVTDSVGTPVAGAKVSVDTGQETTTAADGSYVFALLKPGTRTLTFTKAHYATTSQTPTVDENFPTQADATLSPDPGTISGTVSAANRGPLSGVTVKLDGTPIATTAANGSYSLPASAGRHTLTFAKAYYLNGAANPTVPAGAGVTANATLTPIRIAQTITRSPNKATLTAKRKHGKATVTLSATVTDARGPIAGQTVRLQRSSNGKTKWKNVYLRVTNAGGRATVVITTKKRQTVYYRWYAPTTAADFTKTSAKQKVRIR
jgi:hypothetical protein